jgi:hypothetical protein
MHEVVQQVAVARDEAGRARTVVVRSEEGGEARILREGAHDTPHAPGATTTSASTKRITSPSAWATP